MVITESMRMFAEQIPEKCPECGDRPLVIIHDTGKASDGYELEGSYCLVDGGVTDTPHLIDELYYIHNSG